MHQLLLQTLRLLRQMLRHQSDSLHTAQKTRLGGFFYACM
jgi:hypothetical protein